MSEPSVRALIFDYDGLIVDSERIEAEAIIEVLAELGATVTFEDFGHLFGTVDADHVWEELVQGWCGRTVADLDVLVRPRTTARKDALDLLPGVLELLEHARERDLRVGLGTGNRMETLERRLGRNGVLDCFEAIVTRAEVERGKPHPDIYLEVARRLEVEPHACLVLEDSVPGCEAAIAAGMRVVACPSVVTAHCAYPAEARRVTSLLELLDDEVWR